MRHRLPPQPKKKIFGVTRSRRRRFSFPVKSVSRRQALFHTYDRRPAVASIPRWVWGSIIALAIGLSLFAFFRLPVFAIQDVRIEGLRYIPEDEIRSFIDEELSRRRLVIFKNNNVMLTATKKLQSRLESEFYITVESITRDLPRGLTLTIKERVGGFVLQTPDQYQALATDGSLLAVVSGPNERQLVIADERALRGEAVPVDYLEQATRVSEAWEAVVPQIAISAFHLTDDRSVMTISTDRPYRVIMNANEEIEPQLRRLSVVLNEASLEEPAEHIDLRFGQNLFLR